MRIAIVSHLPVLGPGGLEVLIQELVVGLAGCHQVVLASPDDPDLIEKSKMAHRMEDFIRVPAQIEDSGVGDRFAEDLVRRSVDTAHFHLGGTYGWRSGSKRFAPIPRVSRRGIRCFTTNHQAVSPLDVNRAGEPLLRRLASFVKNLPGKAACINAVEREFLVSEHDLRLSRRWFPMNANKFGRIYHSCLDDQPPMACLPESRVILNLATVCYRKGQHILAQAFARVADQHPEWKLRLVGRTAEAACEAEIREVASKAGLESRIELAGPTADPLEAIRGAELYAQASLLEGLGLAVQEALYLGRPCLGSRIGGIPELIEDGQTGMLVPVGDEAAWAAALDQAMSDRAWRERTSVEARRSILEKGMTRKAMIDSYLSLYDGASI